MKHKVFLWLAPAALIAFAASPALALSDSELGNISQSCPTIKQSLSQLQRADSRTRTYLGALYESIATDFLTPLSTALVHSGRNDAALTALRNDFLAEQATFRSAYTNYMRAMENLISIDCRTEPQVFYDQLVTAREQRATLRQATAQLSTLLDQQIDAVTALKESL